MSAYERLKDLLEAQDKKATPIAAPDFHNLLKEVVDEIQGQLRTISTLMRLCVGYEGRIEKIKEHPRDEADRVTQYTAGYRDGWNALRKQIREDFLHE